MSTETVDPSPKGDSPVPLPETAPSAQTSAELDIALMRMGKILLASALAGPILPGILAIPAVVPFVVFSLFVWGLRLSAAGFALRGLFLTSAVLGLRLLVVPPSRQATVILLIILCGSIALMLADLLRRQRRAPVEVKP